jgi:hypothetical protein
MHYIYFYSILFLRATSIHHHLLLCMKQPIEVQALPLQKTPWSQLNIASNMALLL